ncbi:MAG: hypothetical protein ACI4UV_15330 [Victivallales bacterium]
MSPLRRKPIEEIDYFARGSDRRRLTEYLRNGNFKKVTGPKELGADIRRRRIVFCCIASLFLLAGLFFIIF